MATIERRLKAGPERKFIEDEKYAEMVDFFMLLCTAYTLKYINFINLTSYCQGHGFRSITNIFK